MPQISRAVERKTTARETATSIDQVLLRADAMRTSGRGSACAMPREPQKSGSTPFIIAASENKKRSKPKRAAAAMQSGLIAQRLSGGVARKTCSQRTRPAMDAMTQSPKAWTVPNALWEVVAMIAAASSPSPTAVVAGLANTLRLRLLGG